MKSRLPGMYESRDWADAGGLIAYGPNDSELSRPSGVISCPLGERGDDVAAKQVDRVHDPRVGQVAHLHEAKDLVDAGLPVLREDLDDAGRVAHGEGARLHMVCEGLARAFLLNRRDGEFVGSGDVASLPGRVELLRHLDEPDAFRPGEFVRLFVSVGAVGDAQSRGLDVDEAPHGFRVLDALAIQTEPFGHLRVAAQVETEGAQTHFPGS